MLNDDEIAVLNVCSINQIGAFLDWGEPKDLFLPYGEMSCELEAGMNILIRKYTDKSGRPAASMKDIYSLLSTGSPYVPGDIVNARIYEFIDNFGVFVAVDDKYSGMIPKHEDLGNAGIGDVISARVVFVKEDGKLDLSTRKPKEEQINQDAKKVLDLINDYAGVLPFTEKAEPAVVMREAGLSKAAFKRAVGMLYRDKKIIITENGTIRLV